MWEITAYIFSVFVSVAKYPQTLLLICMEFSRVACGSMLVAHEGLDSCLWFTVPPVLQKVEQNRWKDMKKYKAKGNWTGLPSSLCSPQERIAVDNGNKGNCEIFISSIYK